MRLIDNYCAIPAELGIVLIDVLFLGEQDIGYTAYKLLASRMF